MSSSLSLGMEEEELQGGVRGSHYRVVGWSLPLAGTLLPRAAEGTTRTALAILLITTVGGKAAPTNGEEGRSHANGKEGLPPNSRRQDLFPAGWDATAKSG